MKHDVLCICIIYRGRLGKQIWGLLKGRLCFCPQNAKLNLSSKPWESERLLNGDPEKFYRSTWKWNMNNSITTITNCLLTGRRVTGPCHHRTESSQQSCWATATYSQVPFTIYEILRGFRISRILPKAVNHFSRLRDFTPSKLNLLTWQRILFNLFPLVTEMYSFFCPKRGKR